MDGIVIGVDESASAACALRWGVGHAAVHQRPATALMAWTSRDQHSRDRGASFDLHYGHQQADRDLDAIVEQALGDEHPELRRRVACAAPATALVAASHDADVVVVGARGMGGFREL